MRRMAHKWAQQLGWRWARPVQWVGTVRTARKLAAIAAWVGVVVSVVAVCPCRPASAAKADQIAREQHAPAVTAAVADCCMRPARLVATRTAAKCALPADAHAASSLTIAEFAVRSAVRVPTGTVSHPPLVLRI